MSDGKRIGAPRYLAFTGKGVMPLSEHIPVRDHETIQFIVALLIDLDLNGSRSGGSTKNARHARENLKLVAVNIDFDNVRRADDPLFNNFVEGHGCLALTHHRDEDVAVSIDRPTQLNSWTNPPLPRGC